jgi:hypothetical protein
MAYIPNRRLAGRATEYRVGVSSGDNEKHVEVLIDMSIGAGFCGSVGGVKGPRSSSSFRIGWTSPGRMQVTHVTMIESFHVTVMTGGPGVLQLSWHLRFSFLDPERIHSPMLAINTHDIKQRCNQPGTVVLGIIYYERIPTAT